MKPLSRTLTTIGLFLFIVAGGIGVAVLLVKLKTPPKKAERANRPTPVKVLVAVESSQPIRVVANGTVVAAQEIVVQPELMGRVVWKNPELVPGGKLKKGEPLLRIDPRDYTAAVEQQLAQLESRRLAFEQERSRRVIAQREWDLFGDAGAPDADPDAEGRSLALREPHLRSAEASLRAAQTAVEQSRIALSRTQIIVPFNALVQSENVDIGQLVSPSAQLARLVGTDAFWVQVSVPVDNLPWIRIPGLTGDDGSPATVSQQIGASRIERKGKVVRLFGDLDPVGRMARVLVEIPEPLRADDRAEAAKGAVRDGASDPRSSSLPLLLGAYVRVHIDAGNLEGVIEIPRTAMHEGDIVYVADADGKLRLRRPSVVWRTEDMLLVRGALKSGDQVIVSQVATALEGMDVRVVSGEPEARSEETSP
jgi:multidrug efflux pump subunit AcrA (membrane-fusion protein)